MGTAPDGGGLSNEMPEYHVTLPSFRLEVAEVTVEAYERCVAARVCASPKKDAYCNASDKPDHPINCVNWVDADTFCRWTGRRLPTEEEWEYAARGTTRAEYPWGNTPPVDQLCWNRAQGTQGTCPVGSYRKTLLGTFNDSGVWDLAGNLLEWTSNEVASYPNTKNCSMNSSSCVIRGGAWINSAAAGVRAAYRGDGPTPTGRFSSLGFRCARDSQ